MIMVKFEEGGREEEVERLREREEKVGNREKKRVERE